MPEVENCGECGGTGLVSCPECDGTGEVVVGNDGPVVAESAWRVCYGEEFHEARTYAILCDTVPRRVEVNDPSGDRVVLFHTEGPTPKVLHTDLVKGWYMVSRGLVMHTTRKADVVAEIATLLQKGD